jgi:hypothetical protein
VSNHQESRRYDAERRRFLRQVGGLTAALATQELLGPVASAPSQAGTWSRANLGTPIAPHAASGAEPAVDSPAAGDDQVAFFLIGDTHYLADKQTPSKMDERSTDVTLRLIETLNRLPGESIPATAGGGKVSESLRGVIHAGDLIDTGDKNGPLADQMVRTEWAAFQADFGISGRDGRLKYPVYEVHGNHDSPRSEGVVIDGICQRNRQRPNVKLISDDGLHYSWDWGPVHFINLGIVVGQVPHVKQARRYAPRKSLDFLIRDLQENVKSQQPVVITHHIDVARYTGPCLPEDESNKNKEWNPCDVRGYYEALRRINVVGILYGHTHVRNVARWNGESVKQDSGFSLYNVDNCSHFGDDRQALMYFEISAREVIVRECATTDRWQTHQWTPQTWRRSIAVS